MQLNTPLHPSASSTQRHCQLTCWGPAATIGQQHVGCSAGFCVPPNTSGGLHVPTLAWFTVCTALPLTPSPLPQISPCPCIPIPCPQSCHCCPQSCHCCHPELPLLPVAPHPEHAENCSCRASHHNMLQIWCTALGGVSESAAYPPQPYAACRAMHRTVPPLPSPTPFCAAVSRALVYTWGGWPTPLCIHCIAGRLAFCDRHFKTSADCTQTQSQTQAVTIISTQTHHHQITPLVHLSCAPPRQRSWPPPAPTWEAPHGTPTMEQSTRFAEASTALHCFQCSRCCSHTLQPLPL